ncbi:hypothetical protein G5B37_03475 [Rasiella rasia]|uniref:Lipoprotein n=1 Tax=Rasiella rasia TaxID=2744027 RepID=A0A6G6GJQ9_9FLAO|nr:hypothetical protein [Rasiella rasia]QIE58653.1 hypothetical protein G5B37_03475 [Rasiella rasia]
MKILLNLTILLLILTSCKSKESMFPDYSKSAYEPILFIKDQIQDGEGRFDVEIKNSHGGNYVVYSKVDVGKDSVRIENDIRNNFYGTKSDTILAFMKADFINLLNTELSYADTQIKIAGNYQDIKITVADSTNVFYTRQGFGIMKIMEKGISNTRKAE